MRDDVSLADRARDALRFLIASWVSGITIEFKESVLSPRWGYVVGWLLVFV